MTQFGKWFANERVRRNYFSQGDFAKAAKVGRSTIFQIEAGEGYANRRPSVKHKIASMFGIDVFELEMIEREMTGRDAANSRAVILPATVYSGLERWARERKLSVPDLLARMVAGNAGSGDALLLRELAASEEDRAKQRGLPPLLYEREPDRPKDPPKQPGELGAVTVSAHKRKRATGRRR